MKITMIGTGYVGFVSGVCFSDFGHEVICVDKDPRKIDCLKAGEVPLYETGFDDLIAKNVAAGRLTFTTLLRILSRKKSSVPIFRGDQLHGGRSQGRHRYSSIKI